MTLDKPKREHLEDVVTEMRETVEDDIEFQVTQEYGLDSPDEAPPGLSEEQLATRERLREAIEREAIDGHDWDEALELYIKGAGYTIINRLAAFRCMEVRDFLDREVTRFREDGRTPAADPILEDSWVSESEAILQAYEEACQAMTEELGILFDLDSPYSVIAPQFETFQKLCELLDDVPDDDWGQDDVLGWVYEYYNHAQLERIDRNDPQDVDEVCVTNQFYTPHWVVRMLTDNSLGKLYLEKTGKLEETLEAQKRFSPTDRKNRSNDPQSSPSLTELATYLVPGEGGEPTDFDDPSDLRIIDPACGSGHFLLYAFDLLERIWWDMQPEVDRQEVPAKILEHNLFGVDLDMRACQLATFNLYLKARARAEDEGATSFTMPQIGIVCADARIADLDNTQEVFDEVAGSRPHVREALDAILESFRDVHGLGSLLDVKGTLEALFAPGQRSILDDWTGDQSLSSFLSSLENEIGRGREGESFLAQDLRSFLRLLLVLSQDFDVAVMNPPYGGANRMPSKITDYVESNYSNPEDFYTAFVELGERLTRDNGRTSALIPRTFINKKRFEEFREDLIGPRETFDFLAEFGLGILDNATVRTAGVVLRNSERANSVGTFIRLYDLDSEEKEEGFTRGISTSDSDEPQRVFQKELASFSSVPGSPLSFWAPKDLRGLFRSSPPLDPNAFRSDGEPICRVVKGSATGDNDRFFRKHWEVEDFSDPYFPLAQGGSEAWITPLVTEAVYWRKNGFEAKMQKGASLKNLEFLGREGLTWTHIKESGRRFGYFPSNGMFDQSGNMVFPLEGVSIWSLLGILNSELYHGLMLVLTPDRHWNVGDVGRLPAPGDNPAEQEIISLAREMYSKVLQLQATDPRSPFFQHSPLRPVDDGEPFHSSHPFAQQVSPPGRAGAPEPHMSLEQSFKQVQEAKDQIRNEIEDQATRLDTLVYESMEVPGETTSAIQEEIHLRDSTPDSILSDEETLLDSVSSLLHEFVLEVVTQDDDGIVLLWNETDDEEPALLPRIEEKFEEIFGDHAHDRLAEADRILESRGTGSGTYPNLEAWLQNKLFEFHSSTFENTPILWKITTEDLVPEPIDEGFACLIDYHQLDAGTFERLQTRYLDKRKEVLIEKRNAADQRSSDASLSAEERAKNAEEYERCEDALRQIEEFEQVLRKLAQRDERDIDEGTREIAADLAPKVAHFRNRTEQRLETLDRLVEITKSSWFKDHFSPTFLERVEENREEWIDALEELETACEAYAQDPSEPVQAHLYDLFPYFDDLVGSTHYGSNGIFFMNYYFSKGEEYLDEKGQPRDGLAERERLLAELAAETDEDVELGKEIQDACERLAKTLPSDWEDRALSEITCNGYQPNKKHGVRINITPLAKPSDQRIVPEIVERKVL